MHDVIIINHEKEVSEQGEEDGGQSNIDKLKEVNFGTIEEPHPTFISASLSIKGEGMYMILLIEYKDIFALSYKEMPGLDPKVAVYHLVIQEIMVDATTGHEALSFMDGSSRYDQIRMTLSDEEMTAFRIPTRIYCYKVMPFGLKSAGATYRRSMQRVFDDMLYKFVESYVDDLVVKSKRRQDLLKDLKVMFNCLQKYQLKMIPLKCVFSVTSGKFLSFILNPSVLRAPVHGKPLILYIAAQERFLGALLAQEEEKGKKHVLYYLSRTLVGAEIFTVHLVAKADPINRRIGAWVGIVLISSEKYMLPYSFALAELCLNNVAEYQALIIGLQITLEIEVSFIEIYGDLKLIINQLLLQYDVKHEDLKSYFAYARQLMKMFDSDAEASNVMISHLIDEEDWRQPIIEYLEHGKLPKDPCHKIEGSSFNILKRKSRSGVCEAHQSGPKLQFQLRRMGYHWIKMVQDSIDYAKKCKAC
ncbi:uncharacterized protein E6C27_scaffold190G001020 [Cucumis melo var. makuwa]|uniref:Reverse transcriptase domain-containing protein n=1 Tax=Cucumis melo var. makuwa TaxID=1194695 RepID=A0A5A7UEC3_CUCMM|nr:uncharacterized protein E6C27_scaffold190G001020 [Cucumis melo var. makuwa]